VPATIPFLLLTLMLWPAVDAVTGEFDSTKPAAIVTFPTFDLIDVRHCCRDLESSIDLPSASDAY
jgi:hypothetical protein